MSDAGTIRIDPRDYRLDGRLLARMWRIAKPYWADKAHWKSWVLMAFGILMGPAWGYYNFKVATITSNQATALATRNQSQWESIFWLLFLLGLGQWAYQQIVQLLNQVMKYQWYRWMTEWMVAHYLGNKAYYDIGMKGDIDNPDERIESGVGPIIEAVLELPSMVIGTVSGIVTNGILLNGVVPHMTLFVVAYSLAGIALQTAIYWPLIRKNFDLVAANADLRFGLLRIRENAETIAFFRGENMEEAQIRSRVRRVVGVQMNIFYYGIWTNIITKFFGDIWTFAPLVLIYPLYFSGKIEFGVIALATGAASQLQGSIGSFKDYIPFVAGVAPRVVRLAQIVERFEQLDADHGSAGPHIAVERAERIELVDVCFETPGGEQKLAQHVSLSVEPGQSLIITGQTGVGKSSILRSMAGLWSRGSGTMIMPPPERMMFVPQKPYMMLGDMRSQLLYPYGRSETSDAELQAVLERVCLPDLIRHNGGLDAMRDWSRILSLGEQQRISFARILLSRPGFVFLDESTSAVDIPTEATLYRLLGEAGTTFVSVGHRETILQFHDRALRLETGGGWTLLDPGSIVVPSIEPLGARRERPGDKREDVLAATSSDARF